MENLTAQFLPKLPPPLWNSNIRFLTSLIARPNLTSTSSLRRSSPLSLDCSTPQSTFDIHQNRFLSSLPRRLSHPGSCPQRLLQEDGDWSKDQFFAVIRFLLRHSSRLHEILPVFDAWKTLEPSRINEANYEKIIRLLCAERSMNEAVRALQSMIDDHKIKPSLEIYNSIIHGYADGGKFEEAMLFLNGMKENGVLPETETYDGLIQGYGKWQMYDEIVLCVKRMESEGCASDHVTYNLLVREFARGGLLKRMERMYQSLMSRKMTLEPVTLVSMLEAYAEFGVLERMEETYDKILRSDLAWCLRGLCHACLVSRKGLDYLVKEMNEATVPWSTTFANIVLLAYWKMGDFKSINELLLFELWKRRVKLDLVTVGMVFDLSVAGFEGTAVFMSWKKNGFLDKPVEMKTDPLVHAAFGEGQFLRSCKEVMKQESKSFTYQYLLEVVVKNQKN
ncbi:hypothetical protein Bca52824_057846 [Brassica carinata]|uniref:Pentatricopeptide repeat-containing protein n=1 Tax=Brassica carinata TaxID=52824 RepID=A0A8X7QSC9_BRACI|nr:hypothetical protein Bca52824_057846 [Brassica carinata]